MEEALAAANEALSPDVLPDSMYMYRSLSSGTSSGSGSISLRFAVVTVQNKRNGKSKEIVALMDDGSNLTVIADELADSLGVEGPYYDFSVVGISGAKISHRTRLSHLSLSCRGSSLKKNLVARTLPDPAGNLHMTDWNVHKSQWIHLAHLNFPDLKGVDTKVQMIIGNDQSYLHRALKEVYGPEANAPIARLTPLGWTATGRIQKEIAGASKAYSRELNSKNKEEIMLDNPEQSSFNTGEAVAPLETLSKRDFRKGVAVALQKAETEVDFNKGEAVALQKAVSVQGNTISPYYKIRSQEEKRVLAMGSSTGRALTLPELEKMLLKGRVETENAKQPDGTKSRPPVLNSGDRSALLMLYKETHRLGNGHFQAPVLWAGSSRPKNNFVQALESWKQLERKLSHNSEKRLAYEKVVQGWLEAGYMRRLSVEEENREDAFYLLHFPVYREDKETTKTRIVMNGKSEFQGTSLNDCVLKGPKVINNLVNVLLRFRRFRVAVSGDVKEMFLQVHLKEEDAKYHRIVFSFREENGYCILEAKVHLFGNRGSPTIVIFVIKWAATLFQETHSLGADTILDSSLVDDCMDSVRTEEDAKQLVNELTEIFEYCGMKIHKWVCSHEGVVPGPRVTRMVKDPQADGEFPGGKALGIAYDPIKDEFRFKEKTRSLGEPWTRRKALGFYMSLYDPLGFILPVLMVARVLFQETWYAEREWEKSLDKELQSKWDAWANQLTGLPVLSFPRWLKVEELDLARDKERVGVHVFCDASKLAIGACAYIVTEKDSVLALAKGKIIKRKGTSIPSNELCSGELGVSLAKVVCAALGLEFGSVWFWLDALSVLGWIKAPPRSLPYHVARIAGRIREETDPNHWRHVSTKLNPADLISRGATVKQLARSDLWLRGPSFLVTGDWPKERVKATEIVPLPEEEKLTRLIGIFHISEAVAHHTSEAVAHKENVAVAHTNSTVRAEQITFNDKRANTPHMDMEWGKRNKLRALAGWVAVAPLGTCKQLE